MLVMWRQQSNRRPRLAGVSKVAKAAGFYVQKLRARKVVISGRRDETDLKTLCADEAIIEALEFVENAEVGKKPAEYANKNDTDTVFSLTTPRS